MHEGGGGRGEDRGGGEQGRIGSSYRPLAFGSSGANGVASGLPCLEAFFLVAGSVGVCLPLRSVGFAVRARLLSYSLERLCGEDVAG